jgi:hypothetical protein
MKRKEESMVGGRVQRVCVDSCRGRGQSRVITDTLYLSIVSMLFEECSHSLSKIHSLLWQVPAHGCAQCL